MVSDIFNYKELMDKNNFGIKKYKSATYKGQIHQNTQQRDGYGV